MRGQGTGMGNRRAGDPKKQEGGPVEGSGEGGRAGLPSPSLSHDPFSLGHFPCATCLYQGARDYARCNICLEEAPLSTSGSPKSDPKITFFGFPHLYAALQPLMTGVKFPRVISTPYAALR
jgi:hypothetical protein